MHTHTYSLDLRRNCVEITKACGQLSVVERDETDESRLRFWSCVDRRSCEQAPEEVLTLLYDTPVGDALHRLSSRNVLSAPVMDLSVGIEYKAWRGVYGCSGIHSSLLQSTRLNSSVPSRHRSPPGG